ncbi:ribonucleoside-triphosphate reductase, adenosylcobalamin-dependent [Criblamydia sequanensis]|uniref:Adenosylcobalamin-dependent ribonucleoside-triphosphate reductase n=1 Tax=Candidatus Criblamydia sequanensis CRIB-18 TaxID=1437425 RepID=A0A090D2G4_9BACT|nr:ribonucleoside-triphosphate reductase, adenosylcobalamin-dependent [Criblamydia sequanensis]CDR34323.1 Adenosylcobalamin-dependent ribonucleoside-triphosphate reductase [Criblamydia sequanensis CRIB-18]
MTKPTARALATSLRTYHRPVKEGDDRLESWNQVVERVIQHQRWLWERALGRSLIEREEHELEECRQLILGRYIAPAGRTLWLGGTELSRKRESCMFNCSFTHVETVYDLVDVLWLLLQGCGVGFRPITGTLNGFRCPLHEIRVIRSNRTEKGGIPHNVETYDPETRTWTVKVGDSAIAWAKAIGKLVAGKFPARTLVLDFSEIRPAGTRLKGYGWISSGDEQIAKAFKAIAEILSNRADQLLTRMDILDIVNWLGTILSSRRSAQIALFEYGQPEWDDFALAKKEWWLNDKSHRQQSNNSLLFYSKPTRAELERIFQLMLDSGGSEPGFINATEAERRAPWFRGCNPCVEILLGNKSFCNLTEINVLAFKGDKVGLENALRLAARMNYRQTMVNLRDEILQEAWHLNNDFLHLCGVGLTGIRARPDLTRYDFKRMRNIAVSAAYSMANELNAPLPKNVTCVKPSGTISKIMGTEEWGEVPEGTHIPLGRYIFNNITYSKHDPLVERFKKANYSIIEKPFEPESVIVKFPIKYESVPFTRKTVARKNGKIEEVEVNTDSAVNQLEWYRTLMDTWCEQNVSNTISYDPSEIPEIIDWFLEHWDCYVGVSFIFRNDPTKKAEDLGYAYLPQEVVTKEEYEEYVAKLLPINYEGLEFSDEELAEECLTGACPIR